MWEEDWKLAKENKSIAPVWIRQAVLGGYANSEHKDLARRCTENRLNSTELLMRA